MRKSLNVHRGAKIALLAGAGLLIAGCQQLGVGGAKVGSDKWCEQMLDRQPATISLADTMTFAEDCGDVQIELAERTVKAGLTMAEKSGPAIAENSLEEVYAFAQRQSERPGGDRNDRAPTGRALMGGLFALGQERAVPYRPPQVYEAPAAAVPDYGYPSVSTGTGYGTAVPQYQYQKK